MKKIFALVDCNNFYASCERVFNPSLEGKPVAVLSNNDGCIVARSNEVKALDVPIGAPVFKYREILEKNKVACLSSNYALYADMSMRVMETLSQFSPDMEIYSIDEAFLNLEDLYLPDLTKYAKEIAYTVKKWTGIPVSIGIASTKTLAKLASKLAKKNSSYEGVFNFMDIENIDEYLKNFDVGDVWGVGRSSTRFLKECDVFTALDLKNKSDSWVKKELKTVGLKTVLELRGTPCIEMEVHHTRKSVLCSRSFGKKITRLEDLMESVAYYASRASEKLREQNCAAHYLTVFVRTARHDKGPHYSNYYQMQFDTPTSSTPELIKKAHEGLKKIYRSGFRYGKAGIMLNGIVEHEQVQKSLFSDDKKQLRDENLMKAMDSIANRWGHEMIKFAAVGINPTWKMKQEKRSLQATTEWDELLTVNAD